MAQIQDFVKGHGVPFANSGPLDYASYPYICPSVQEGLSFVHDNGKRILMTKGIERHFKQSTEEGGVAFTCSQEGENSSLTLDCKGVGKGWRDV